MSKDVFAMDNVEADAEWILSDRRRRLVERVSFSAYEIREIVEETEEVGWKIV